MSPEQAPDGKFIAGNKAYNELLADPLVSDWINSYDSQNVKNSYLYAFKQFLDRTNKTPKELLTLTLQESKQLIRRETQKIAQTSSHQAYNVQVVLKSFYAYHDKEIPFKRGEKIRRKQVKIDVEKILDPQDIYKLADVAQSLKLRTKAVILCLFQSGVRPSCLCNWNYGLVADQLYPDINNPVRLRITSKHDTKLSSQNIDYYYTFLQGEAATALKEYIDERKKEENWKPNHKDRIFITETGKIFNYKNLWKTVKTAARLSGLDVEGFWPHTLRKSFRKILNKTSIDEDTKESLMGHTLPGARGNYFDFHDVDEIAKKYSQCDFSRNGQNQVSKLDINLIARQASSLAIHYYQEHPESLPHLGELLKDPDWVKRLGQDKTTASKS